MTMPSDIAQMDAEGHVENASSDKPYEVFTDIDYPSIHTTTNQQADTNIVPTWASYNSVITEDKRPITQTKILLPIPAPAHEWSTLMTVLQHAQYISSEIVGTNKKIVITLDMDLYMWALKLQALKPDMSKFVCLGFASNRHTWAIY